MATMSKLPASARASGRIRAMLNQILALIVREPPRPSASHRASEVTASDGFGRLDNFAFRTRRPRASSNHRALAAPDCLLDCRDVSRHNAA